MYASVCRVCVLARVRICFFRSSNEIKNMLKTEMDMNVERAWSFNGRTNLVIAWYVLCCLLCLQYVRCWRLYLSLGTNANSNKNDNNNKPKPIIQHQHLRLSSLSMRVCAHDMQSMNALSMLDCHSFIRSLYRRLGQLTMRQNLLFSLSHSLPKASNKCQSMRNE